MSNKNDNFLYLFKNYFLSSAYNIYLCNDILVVKKIIKDKDINILVIDESIILDNNLSFFSELNALKRSLSIIYLISNNFFNLDVNFYKFLRIEIIKKPLLLDDIKLRINKLSKYEEISTSKDYIVNIPNIEKTEKTKYIFDAIIKVIKNDLNVLISGEHGTGKNQIAFTINNLVANKKLLEISYDDYKNKNFVNLLKKKISIDDFLKKKKIFKEDLSNFILLSNIDTIDLNTQTLLYHELKFKNKNSQNLFKNKRIIATTSINIKNSLRNNNFSNELFYQLDMYNIFTLPLRDRPDDIPSLTKSLLIEYNQKYNTAKDIIADALVEISKYAWPGNTTQLKNFINRCLKVSNKNIIDKEFIIAEINNEFTYYEKNYLENWKENFRDIISKNIRGYLNNSKKIDVGIYYKLLKEFEKPLLIEILKFTNYNQLLSSEILGINRNTLRKKMEDYNIQVIKKTSL